MRPVKGLGLLMVPLALAACATTPPASATPTAALGEVASVDGVQVRPFKVIEDSRCPANVQCVWAGRVRLLARLSLHGLNSALDRELTLGEPVSVFGGKLTLVAVEPKTLAGAGTDAAAYRFTFDLERDR